MNHQDREHEKPPRTAAEEVVREAEEAEADVADTRERHGGDSEAGDALTPNEEAQEDADEPRT
ncbi:MULTISPECIES: hypothetical protein [Streptomyces]|uniref:Uncharacterized protein n=1 Tax=Streptomyces drozdowiczii TaxID=202862 RepID=A0ABY6PLE0_9ACTN|nr:MULTISPECIES: hypothetical protein [Streptomyces]MCX0247586.1 hypothetical protein [Streptomyces drozdowiczii]OKJ73021.1 hypothetical protein AMK30_18895 [Streptomyces sp. CB02460]UZK53033.1 hypothetical protein NEH16_01865 [Streptomyces drozdowiczii]